jgi:uncharacterized membrane protein
MKKILTILMLFFTITTYSKESNLVTETITSVSNKIDTLKTNVINTAKTIDTSSVSKQLYTNLKSGLVGIAGALKVGAEHVYVILVKQQVVNSILYLLCGVLAFILILSFINKNKSDEEWFDEDIDFLTGLGFIRLGQLIIGFILLLVFLCHLDTIVTGFINPEFGALEQIMNWVKEHK